MKRTAGFVVSIAMLASAGSANAAKVGIAFYDGDVGVAGGYLVDYVADPGEVNQPTAALTELAGGAKVITFHDSAATISSGPPSGAFVDRGGVWHADWTPCSLADSHTANCVLPDPTWVQRKAQAGLSATWAAEGRLFGIDVLLGDGNDRYAPGAGGFGEPVSLEVSGGDGNDTIVGGGTYTGIFGGAGNDFIYAADGFDEPITCGDGTDHVRTVDPGDDPRADCEDVAAP